MADPAQTQYALACALVAAFVVLGMLLVCVPRPRKTDFPDPKREAKEKRLMGKQKAAAKAKKDADRARKAAAKKRAKAAK